MKNKTTRHSILLCGREISYEWIRKKVKNIVLHVRRDGTVYVSSPHTVPFESIEACLTQNANFLFQAMERAQAKKEPKPPEIFREGDVLLLFGNKRTLHFSSVFGNQVAELNGMILLPPEEDPEKIRKKLKKYAEERLREIITEMCRKAMPLFPEIKTFPEIRLRAMRSIWGNCRPKTNILTFNSRLISYPLPCIEYIVMHELTHFLVPNHSRAFYESLSEKMPDWETRRQELNKEPMTAFF